MARVTDAIADRIEAIDLVALIVFGAMIIGATAFVIWMLS